LEHEETMRAMRRHYGSRELDPGRRRMARLPEGATPIVCGKSVAPGAHIGNVYVLAGVPEIFASQLDSVLADFGDPARPFLRREIEVFLPESLYADELGEIQANFPGVEIGSYPGRCGSRPEGRICLSSRDAGLLARAERAVRRLVDRLSERGG